MVRSVRSGLVAGCASVAAVLALASASFAQEAAASQQATALTLDSGAGIVFHQIKPERTEDFEWLVAKIKDAFAKTEDAAKKQQGTGIQVLRSMDANPNNPNVMYVVLVNPSVQGADYSMQALIKMVYDAFPTEQQDIFKRVQGAFGGGASRVNLKPVADFSK